MTKQPNFKDYLKRRDEMIAAENRKQEEKKHLHNEKTFYPAFIDDLREAEKEVIIYSPYISKFRSDFFAKTIRELNKRKVPVFIFTRPVGEHEYYVREDIKSALKNYEEMGAKLFYLKGSIHEKLAIIDRQILWEGSLNILSQRNSREIMRRIFSEDAAREVILHLKIYKELAKSYKDRNEKLPKDLTHDPNRNYIQIVKVFYSRALVPFVSWWLSAIVKIIIVTLKSINLLASIIKFLY